MFKKGQRIHFIASLNGKAKVVVYRGVVRSCTPKTMVIRSDETSYFLGKIFRNQQDQPANGRVFADLTDKQVEGIAEAMCEEIRERQIDRSESALTAYCKRNADDELYPRVIRGEIKALIADQATVYWP